MKISLAGLRLISLQSKSDISVLVEMIDIYTSYVKVNKHLKVHRIHVSEYRDIILPILNMKPNTFSDSIRNLYNAGLIIRVSKGMYTVSERLFN